MILHHAPNDLGIVLFATGDGSGSFTKRSGAAGTVRTLIATNYIASEWFYPGAAAALAITISGVISSNLASVVVKVERRRLDTNNSTLFYPSLIGTVRSDSPATLPAASQTILRAALAGVDVSDYPAVTHTVEVLDVTLLTTDHVSGGECRVIVLCSNAPDATDKIIVGVNVG